MRIALLGDIHAYRLAVAPWQLVGKRLVGQANLWLNRRHTFDRALLRPVVERIASIGPDLVLLSGDLTTTALPGEFEDVAGLLEPLTLRFPTVIVPGNHDRYTFASARHRSMERAMPGGVVPSRWPYVRELTERWRLLAVDAAVPRVLNSRGLVGRKQLARIRRATSSMSEGEGLVVLCHYPINSPPRALPLTWDHKLADSMRFRRVLKRCRARVLYLHGHIHRPWCWQPRRSRLAHVTYVNAGSPCHRSAAHPLGQGFWQIELPEDPRGPLGVVHHLPESSGKGARGYTRQGGVGVGVGGEGEGGGEVKGGARWVAKRVLWPDGQHGG